MRNRFSAIIIGATVMGLGIIFHLQGHSVIGPQSSFMYSNPDWVTHGMQIVIAGAIILAGGTILLLFKK